MSGLIRPPHDEIEYELRRTEAGFEVEIKNFASDRLRQKIEEYNQKRKAEGKRRTLLDAAESAAAAPKKIKFKPLAVSANGLELIEFVSLDCTMYSLNNPVFSLFRNQPCTKFQGEIIFSG